MSLLEKRRGTVFVAALILFGANSLTHALYVQFKGTDVTWSNTKLGGGPAQPIGWVQVPDPPPGFTGEISASQFLSVAAVVVYGTSQTVTWGTEHLLSESTVSFRDGEVSDMNLVFYDPGYERLLVVSGGPPSPNAVLVNSPRPPCVHWPGFEDLEFCGARVAVEMTTSTGEPSGNVAVAIPPTPPPTYAANAEASLNGSVRYNANGGLSFDAPYTHLNAYGPFRLTTTMEWQVVRVDDPQPWTLRVWFTKVHIDHNTTLNGAPIALEDDDYWALGEPNSWLVMRGFTLAHFNAFCEALTRLRIGVCDLQQQSFDPGHAKAAFGVFDSTSAVNTLRDELATAFLFDLSKMVAHAQLSNDFQGSLHHKALTVTVFEKN